MATPTSNNWKDSLPPGVAEHAKLIDEDWDEFAFDTTTCTAKQVNGFLLHHIIFYRNRCYADSQLWEYFREDFMGWTADTWALGNVNIVRDFRDFLRRNGVYVAENGNPIASNIQAVITSTEEPIWTEAKIIRQLRKPKNNPYSSEGNFNSYQNPQNADPPPGAALPPRGALPLRVAPPPPPPLQPTGEPLPREVTNLMKVYSDEEKKFGGELYDMLGAKLQVFYDCCNKVGIQRHQYHHAFSVILKGRAATFYYDHIAGKNYSFDIMLQLTRAHFETDENRQLYMSEWRETTF